MGGAMSRIMPSIYVGGIASLKTKTQLDAENVTHVCSVVGFKVDVVDGRKQKIFNAGDSPDEDLTKYFEEACLFIHEARASGGAALIHCACGVSRSVTITLAYIMTITGLPLRQAFKAIQGARHCACPNHGFVSQLMEFEKSDGPTKLKAKLVDRFGEWPTDKLEADLKELRQHIATQEYYIEHGYYENEQPVTKGASCSSEDSSNPSSPSSVFFTTPVSKIPTLDDIISEIPTLNSATSSNDTDLMNS